MAIMLDVALSGSITGLLFRKGEDILKEETMQRVNGNVHQAAKLNGDKADSGACCKAEYL